MPLPAHNVGSFSVMWCGLFYTGGHIWVKVPLGFLEPSPRFWYTPQCSFYHIASCCICTSIYSTLSLILSSSFSVTRIFFRVLPPSRCIHKPYFLPIFLRQKHQVHNTTPVPSITENIAQQNIFPQTCLSHLDRKVKAENLLKPMFNYIYIKQNKKLYQFRRDTTSEGFGEIRRGIISVDFREMRRGPPSEDSGR